MTINLLKNFFLLKNFQFYIVGGDKQSYISLKKKNIPSYRLDSELLLSKTLKKKREKLLINLDQKISLINVSKFNCFIKRRSNKEPLAYILKEKEFWSKNFINRFFYINDFCFFHNKVIS